MNKNSDATLAREEQWLLDEKHGGKKTVAYQQDVERLHRGEPKDYVIGFVEFLGCKIDLSKKPLIPRFETEFWAEQVIEDLRSKNQDLRILDMFAGSGCLGISIVRHIPQAHVVFADSEKNCIEQIEINCRLNKIPTTIYEIIQSNIFENVKGVFDIIVANPPYIPATKEESLQKSVIDHEPKAALFGGHDGLQYIEIFLAKAKEFLTDEGRIFMEFDSFQKSAIEMLLVKYGYQGRTFHKDQYDRWRWIDIGIKV